MLKYVMSDLNTVINSLNVPVGNLGVTRAQMPQFGSTSKLRQALNAKGINYTDDTTNVSNIRLAQSEINKTKVFKLMRKIRSKGINAMDEIVVSRDGYVLDGSHRFVAKYNQSKRATIPSLTVDMDALDFINTVKNNPNSFGASYRNYSDSKLSK